MSVEHVHALAKGTRLNQYEVMNILGAGGFGITYMAKDISLDTMVAIKEYLPGDFAVRQENSAVTAKSSTSLGDFQWGLKRFLDEARVLAKFRHPNIVRVNQIFEANQTAYLVMEYAKGESLDDYLHRVGPIDETKTKEILFPIMDGLRRVHEQGFLHRDIKPGNIILRDEGGAVLIDFGAARQAMENKNKNRGGVTSIVTEGYAPLEQYDPNGNQGPWSDIYALGGVAYKCLTGSKPPGATSRVRNDPLAPLMVAAKGRVSKEFASAVEAALSVYEHNRPQSLDEFIAMLSGKMAPRPAAPVDDAARMINAEATRMMRPDSANVSPATEPSQPMSTSAPAQQANVAAATAARPRASTSGARYMGAVAGAILVIAAGGWFYLQNANVQNAGAPQAATETPAASAAVPAPITPAAAPESAPQQSASAAPPAPLTAASAPEQPTALPVPAAPAPAPPPPVQQPPRVASAPPPAPAPRAVQQRPALAPAPAPPTPAIRASFNCATPSNAAERIVCSDHELAELDLKTADMYRKGLTLVADPNAFRGEQQQWLSERDVCADKACLVSSYGMRIKELERWIGP